MLKNIQFCQIYIQDISVWLELSLAQTTIVSGMAMAHNCDETTIDKFCQISVPVLLSTLNCQRASVGCWFTFFYLKLIMTVL